MSTPFLIVMNFILGLSAFSAFGQGSQSGGSGELHDPTAQAAWFLGLEPVKYCILYEDGFGISLARAESEIKSAMQVWTSYIEKKHVLELGHDHPKTITTSFQRLSNCDGNQELTFYLGVNVPEGHGFEEARKSHPFSVGLAIREQYDFKEGRGRGYIWVSKEKSLSSEAEIKDGFPNWNVSTELTAVLIHELGHVFGNGHTPGTIMRENYVDLLRFQQGHQEGLGLWTTRIDDSAQLYDCLKCSAEGILSNDKAQASEVFEKFMGRPSRGRVSASFQFEPLQLVIRDEISSKMVPIEMLREEGGGQAFSMLALPGELIFAQALEGFSMVSRHLDVGVIYFNVTDAKGNMYPASLDYNVQHPTFISPLQLRYFDGSKRKSLFLMTLD